MNGRERILAALSPEGSPEIPAVICYESIFIRDSWDDLAGLPWWYAEAPDIPRQAQWRAEVMRRICQDWFELPSCPSRAERRILSIVERGGRVFRVDSRTGEETLLEQPRVSGWDPSRAAASVHPVAPPSTPDEVDAAIPAPSPDAAAVSRADGRCDLARRLLDGPGRALFPLRHVSSPLWSCYDLWGFEGLMTRVAEEPDLVRRACARYLARAISRIGEAAALGARGIWVEECMTDMIGPDAFRRLNLPFLDALLGEIRARGLASFYYYCGSPARTWDMILGLPADSLALEEGKKGFSVDIEEVVDRVGGRRCVLGNLDAIALLPRASEDDLRGEIGRQIRAGRRNGSRFIMSIGSPVTPETPVPRVRWYCDTARELGR